MRSFTRIFIAFILAACNGVCAFAQVKPTAVTFQYSESLIFVRVKVNNAKGLLFLMDTGANISVIDNETADRLQLISIQKDSVLGTAGKESVRLVKIKALEIADLKAENIQISRRDLSKFIKLNNEKIDGILGTDMLKNYAIAVDFRTKRISFSRAPVAAGKMAYIPFEMTGGIPRVEAKINDTLTTYLRYNSGVSLQQSKDVYVNVSPSQWRKLKTADRKLTTQRYMTATGVGGDVRLQVVNINKLEFRGMMIKFPFIIVQPRQGYFEKESAIGFFGNNMLDKYNKVTIDFLSSQIVFNTITRPY